MIDGHSFLPLLRGEVEEIRDWIFTDYRPGMPKKGIANASFAYDRSFKLYSDGRFYNLASDVREERPLRETELTSDAAAARATIQGVLQKMHVENSPP